MCHLRGKNLETTPVVWRIWVENTKHKQTKDWALYSCKLFQQFQSNEWDVKIWVAEKSYIQIIFHFSRNFSAPSSEFVLFHLFFFLSFSNCIIIAGITPNHDYNDEQQHNGAKNGNSLGLYLYMLVVETFSGDNLKFNMYALIGWGKLCIHVLVCQPRDWERMLPGHKKKQWNVFDTKGKSTFHFRHSSQLSLFTGLFSWTQKKTKSSFLMAT